MIKKWMFKQFIRLHVFMYRRSNGKTMGRVQGMPILLLTTVGRKTGKIRVTPTIYFQDGNNYVVIASNNGADKHPAWFINLKANPQTTIEVGGTTFNVSAEVVSSEKKEHLWSQFAEQAPFIEDHQKNTTREIPMVVLKSIEA